jgi:hypothetical protein
MNIRSDPLYGRLLVGLLGLLLSACAVSPQMSDSLAFVREHKGQGARQSLLGSEPELMDEALAGLEGQPFIVTREPHALFAKATTVNMTYAYHFEPSQKPGHTDVEILLASPWLTPQQVNKFQSDQFWLFSISLTKTRLLDTAWDPNVKEGYFLPLTAIARRSHRDLALQLLKRGARPEPAIAELKSHAQNNVPYLDKPANRKAHDDALAAVAFLQGLQAEKVTTERNVERTTELKALLDRKDMTGLRSYLDAHPEMLAAIDDPQLRLRYTGPPDLRIVDIMQLVKNQKKDALIIARINSTQAPYKLFTVTEMSELTGMGISDEVVAAMIAVTAEYNKEQKRLSEQSRAAPAVATAAPAQQNAAAPAAPAQPATPEANSPGECLKLIAALKACDQSGGFLKMACQSLARTQFNCPRL